MKLKIPLAAYVSLYAMTALKVTLILLLAAGMSMLLMTRYSTGPHETVTGVVTSAGMRTGKIFSLSTTELDITLSSWRRVQTTLPSSLPIRLDQTVELDVYKRMVMGTEVYAFVRYLEPLEDG